MEPLILPAAIVAVIKATDDALDKNYRTLIIIVSAGILGALAVWSGLAEVAGLSIGGGFLSGLAASGAVTVAQKIHGN